MLIKTQPDEIQSFLSDSSYIRDGRADRVVFPESDEEVAEILAAATRDRTPVTISGAGTGTVGGRVASGGVVLATDKRKENKSFVRDDDGGRAVVQAGVVLADLQRFVDSQGLLYAPDPTERDCFIGGNVATNASGSRTFKYGPTRAYVERLKIALATGELIDIRRGEHYADSGGRIAIPLQSGRTVEARLPSYRMPQVRKVASGYYVAPRMDVIDLFIGNEGTLGVIVEVEVKLLLKPEGILAGIVFFDDEDQLLAFVSKVRDTSLCTRAKLARTGKTIDESFAEKSRPDDQGSVLIDVDARALEYFDRESLSFLRERYPLVPASAVGATFFEQ